MSKFVKKTFKCKYCGEWDIKSHTRTTIECVNCDNTETICGYRYDTFSQSYFYNKWLGRISMISFFGAFMFASIPALILSLSVGLFSIVKGKGKIVCEICKAEWEGEL